MDYLHPIEGLIPGARGQVLSALTQDTSSRTVRQVSADARVSWSRTSEIINDLANLGLVERRQTPGGILVRLVPENVATKLVQAMVDLRSAAIEDMRQVAEALRPAPISLTLFGTFARGTARRDSDVDVVAVIADSPGPDSDLWEESSARWVQKATAIAGNPVNLIEVRVDELAPSSGRDPAWLKEASEQGIVLAGKPLGELISTGKSRRRRA